MRRVWRPVMVALAFAMTILLSPTPVQAHSDGIYTSSNWKRGFDFSWDKPSGSQVRSAGGEYVMVYISPYSSSGKHVSKSQITAYLNAGVRVGLIYETSASRALGGCSAGKTDAAAVNSLLRKYDLPQSTPVYSGAIDFDVTSSQLGIVAQYLDCQVDIRGSKDLVGVYGDYTTIERAAWWGYTRLWQTYAWSPIDKYCTGIRLDNRCWSPHADLRQVHNGWKVSGHDTDLNYAADLSTVGFIGDTSVTAVPLSPSVATYPVVKYGARGADARAVQGALYDRGWRITVDGAFGPRTLSIVKQFQAEKGLVVDGIAGPATFTCLYTCPVT